MNRLCKDQRGAVLAEFVIALVPLLLTFFSFVQLSKLATVRLVVKHATIIGARGAAVLSNVNDNNPGALTDGREEVSQAVQVAMDTWINEKAISDVNVVVDDQSSRTDPYGWVTVTTTATYHCRVPLGFVACGGQTKILSESYRMPHQGANYR